MEIIGRNFRFVSRLLRTPVCATNYRSITNTTVRDIEDVNLELFNSFNKDIKAGGVVPVFRRALLFPTRVALQDQYGLYTYAGLHQAASILSNEISSQLLGETERTICYMCGNDSSHIISQWAIWMSGNIAVPLTPLHPPELLKYFIKDSDCDMVICSQDYEKNLRPITLELSKPLLITTRDKQITAQLYQPSDTILNKKTEDILGDFGRPNSWYGKAEALIIYTSGTTSQPKGVVWTHSMLSSQIASLHTAWQYSATDVVLHALPLHHIHGQLNSMIASLAAGARLRMLSEFAAHTVWARLLGMGERDETKVTVFHGVPAMYAKLVSEHGKMFADAKLANRVRDTLAGRMRLMCAGSASLPDKLLNKWEEISGIRLLERYGMTEVGMAISNPYRPVTERTVGCVGLPLPGVSARIAGTDDKTGELLPLVTVETQAPTETISLHSLDLSSVEDYFEEKDHIWQKPTVSKHTLSEDDVFEGELLLKGKGVFTRYWNRAPKLDESDFTKDGWFRTGDTARFANNKFQILGRTSIDIIKTAGYKVSALQVEAAILEHPSVSDAAAFGIPHESLGEVVTAVVTLKEGTKLTLRELKEVISQKLAPYQLPRSLLVVEKMPRNTMGKLDKKEIRKLYENRHAGKKS